MNKEEQEYYKNIKRIAIALEKIANKPEQPRKLLKDGGPIRIKAVSKIKHI